MKNFFSFCVSEKVLFFFTLIFERYFLFWGITLDWQFLNFQMLLHCLLACIVSDEKLALILIFFPLYIMCPSSPLQLLLKFSHWFYDVPCCSFIHTSCIWGSFSFLYFGVSSLHQIWENFNNYLFKYFSCAPASPLGTPVNAYETV